MEVSRPTHTHTHTWAGLKSDGFTFGEEIARIGRAALIENGPVVRGGLDCLDDGSMRSNSSDSPRGLSVEVTFILESKRRTPEDGGGE